MTRVSAGSRLAHRTASRISQGGVVAGGRTGGGGGGAALGPAEPSGSPPPSARSPPALARPAPLPSRPVPRHPPPSRHRDPRSRLRGSASEMTRTGHIDGPRTSPAKGRRSDVDVNDAENVVALRSYCSIRSRRRVFGSASVPSDNTPPPPPDYYFRLYPRNSSQ